MEKKYFAESELIINEDGSIFHRGTLDSVS